MVIPPIEFDLTAMLEDGREWIRTLVLWDLDKSRLLPEERRAGARTELRRLIDEVFGSERNTTPYTGDGWATLTSRGISEALRGGEVIRRRLPDTTSGVTVSVGMAALVKRDPSLTFWSAQGALMEAKAAGRNIIVRASADVMVMKSTYYPRALSARLSELARRSSRPESALLREALETYLVARERELETN